MCGICGIAGSDDTVRLEDARRMADALRHRGPDDSGSWASEADPATGARAAFGHRRLAILDLSARGRQPMASSDGSVVVAYNGEIYNYRALRAELATLGHAFGTETDTEVLLAAYREWGEGTWERLVGMFAFALWDEARGALLLVRDRLGIKPLFYCLQGGRLLFASELGALRAHPRFSARIEASALESFLRFGYVTGPQTIYEEVFRVLPGESVVWCAGGVVRERWWAPGRRPRPAAPEAALEEALLEAVRCRLVADVPLGAFLSGGIDSSAVVALMREVSPGPVRTFTIGFHEQRYDEAAHARAVAAHLGTEHRELRLEAREAVDVARELPALFDEPFADPSAIPTVLVSRLARDHVTVALTGDGGDELFGGYDRYRRLRRLAPLLGLPQPLRGALGRGLAAVPHPGARRWGELLAGDPDAGCEALTARVPAATIAAWTGRSAPPPRPAYLETWRSWDGDAVDRCRAADLRTWLADDILVKLDRATMSVGLEGRVPLLDHRVVDLALALDVGTLWSGGLAKTPLRRILYRRVPRALVERPKRGFGLPLQRLLGEEMQGWERRYLTPDRLAEERLLQPAAVRRSVDRLDLRRSGDARILWHLLCFERWFARHHRGEAGD